MSRPVRRATAAVLLASGLTFGIGALSTVPALAVAPAGVDVVGLSKGTSGPAVVALQNALNHAGIGVKYGVDGYFGSATQASVKAFQNYKHLPVTGVVDIATARALGLAAPAAPTPTAAPARPTTPPAAPATPAAAPATPTPTLPPTSAAPTVLAATSAIPPVSPRAATAVTAALSQLGVPYRFAASTPGVAFDCSGLTAWAWAQAGVSLPHQSLLQYLALPHVPAEAAQPGDLLFFHAPISHVTVYVGNGTMVQAPSSQSVVQVAKVNWTNVVAVCRPG